MSDPQEVATPSDPHSAEALAQAFHENYERLAPSFGYETRKDSAVEWAEVPEPNRSLMIAVAAALIEQVRVSRDAEVAELKAKIADAWDEGAQIGGRSAFFQTPVRRQNDG